MYDIKRIVEDDQARSMGRSVKYYYFVIYATITLFGIQRYCVLFTIEMIK